MITYGTVCHSDSLTAITPEQTVRRVLESWMTGRVADAINLFADSFLFADHALALEFRDKERLCEFFERVEQLFPGFELRVDSVCSCRGNVTAEWTLTATRNEPFLGAVYWKFPIKAQGVSVVQVEAGKVRCWTDYYDKGRAYRSSVADFFSEWVEL